MDHKPVYIIFLSYLMYLASKGKDLSIKEAEAINEYLKGVK